MTSRLTALLIATGLSLQTGSFAQDDGLDVDDLFADEFEESEQTATIHDPIEGFNRAIFNFNDGFYKHLAKPFANTYSNIMPDPAEKGIGNFFYNAKFPSRFVSNVFQARFGEAGKETGQFLVNTTAGIGGLFKVSDEFEELDTNKEDFGQVLGSWGMGHGFYVVLPFIGPTSLRDFVADFADDAVEPIPSPNSLIDESSDRILLRGIEFINELPYLMDLYDSMSRSAIDSYASVRDAYAQRRARQVAE